ncbi:MAG: SsrA-binding protein SmpB [bacterium]|nr:SsrA-binding protein SmpB [bacterium]
MNVLATNSKARFDYDILETIEAGIELLGHEVKAAKTGRAKLVGSFVHLRSGEAWLTNAFIGRYAKASRTDEYDPNRSRRLLLKKRDMRRITGKQQADRLTLIPLRMIEKRGLVKVDIALARGKRKYEKRETIKKREDDRRMRRATMRST